MAVLVDTDVLIWHLSGYAQAAQALDRLPQLTLEAMSHFELLQGMRNKAEMTALQQEGYTQNVYCSMPAEGYTLVAYKVKRQASHMRIGFDTFRQPFTSLGDTMPKAKERTSDFGARLTELRKTAGYTQVQLAAALGTTQRMIAYYENRAEKAPAALLPQMAAALHASADELLGIKPLKKGKKPDTQLHRRLQRIEKLDLKAKRQITQLLDTFIEREELKQRVNAQGA